ncbi:rogdi-like [Sigmodon hispidus]
MATTMAVSTVERAVLEEEFCWLLSAEVNAVLRQLQDILKEASLCFTLSGPSTEGPTKQENFILGSCGTDQVKGVLTLQGDALSQADVNLKMSRNNQLLHFAFRKDKQWKLQQIQDARNHRPLANVCTTQLHARQPTSTKNFRPSGGAVLHSPGAMFEWGSLRLELCQQLKDKISVFSSYWSPWPF